MIRGGAVSVLLAAVLALGGCNPGSDDAASLEAMLGRVPDTTGTREFLVYGNLARLRDGKVPSDETADRKALIKASGGRYSVAEPLSQVAGPELIREIGFGHAELDASLTAGLPPTQLSVFTGRIDPEKVGNALTKTASFARNVERGEHDGQTTYAVGKEGKLDLRQAGPIRRVGQSLRFGVDGGTVMLAARDRDLDSAVVATNDASKSLAGNDEYLAIAKAMDEAKAFNAVLLGAPNTWTGVEAMIGRRTTPEQVARVKQEMAARGIGLAPWQVAGLADAKGQLLVVLWHKDKSTAETNALRLRSAVEKGISYVNGQPWSSRLGVTSIEVRDNLLVARLTSKAPVAVQIVSQRDNLIAITVP